MKKRELKKDDIDHLRKIFSLYWTDPEFLDELTNELTGSITSSKQSARFLVAEDDGEILGVIGYRKIPDYLKKFYNSERVAELYVVAVKYKRKGIGKLLHTEALKIMKGEGIVEILAYSPKTHADSWNFYKNLGFENIGEVTPPDEEEGVVFRRAL